MADIFESSGYIYEKNSMKTLMNSSENILNLFSPLSPFITLPNNLGQEEQHLLRATIHQPDLSQWTRPTASRPQSTPSCHQDDLGQLSWPGTRLSEELQRGGDVHGSTGTQGLRSVQPSQWRVLTCCIQLQILPVLLLQVVLCHDWLWRRRGGLPEHEHQLCSCVYALSPEREAEKGGQHGHSEGWLLRRGDCPVDLRTDGHEHQAVYWSNLNYKILLKYLFSFTIFITHAQHIPWFSWG